MATYKQTRCES